MTTSVVGGLVKIAPSPPVYPSCTIAVAYTPSYVDVFVGGAHQPSATFTATNGTSITIATAALWMPAPGNFLGMSTADQTQLYSNMGNITAITLSGTATTAYTLSYYATNLVLVTFNPALPAGYLILADGNVYLGGAIEVVTVNPVGPSWTTGDEPPTATMPIGSLYSRSDTTHPLWVSIGNGEWAPVSIGTSSGGGGGNGPM